MNRWEKCCEHVGNHMEHIGNIKIPLYKGLVSLHLRDLHFRESKAYLLTHEHVKKCCIQPTNQPQLSHVSDILVLHRGKCVIHFQSHFQHTKMKEEQYELAHDEHTLSTQYKNGQQLPLNGTGMCLFVMGLTSPQHLGRPLTSKVH